MTDRFVTSGVSNLGNRYQAILVSQSATVETVGGTEVATIVLRGRVIGQGGGANAKTDILVHITVVDGRPTAVVEVFEITCTA